MFQDATKLVHQAQHVVVIQPENPDGDSLGSLLALEEILGDMGKQVTLVSAVEVPVYLHYMPGWDRVQHELPRQFDLAIVVDGSVIPLLEKTLTPANRAALGRAPLLIFDHHLQQHEADHLRHALPNVTSINEAYVATGELLADWALANKLPLNPTAAEHLAAAILADSLGLTTEATTARTFRLMAQLVEHGANITQLETRRRAMLKKSPEVLEYKGRLLQRIEYFADGALALVHIPWEEIQQYSHQYNPSMLVLDEMRLVEGVQVAVALKTYPDGKLTAKIRANAPIAGKLAEAFDAGGHKFAAGFKVYTHDLAGTKHKLIEITDRLLREYTKTITATEPC